MRDCSAYPRHCFVEAIFVTARNIHYTPILFNNSNGFMQMQEIYLKHHFQRNCFKYIFHLRDRHGRDRMVVEFTTTYATSV